MMSKRRNRPSSIDALPEEIREAIAKIRIQGRTIDEILAHLKTLDVNVSRSALGRHVKTLSEVSERLKTSRDMATALVNRFGETPDNRLAQLNLELMHDVILKLVTATKDNEDGDPEPIMFEPKDAHFLARALKDLAGAQKTDADRMIIVRKEVARSAAKAAEKVAVEKGISAETVKTIRHAILGIAE